MEEQKHPLSYKTFKQRWLKVAWDSAWSAFSIARGWNEAVRAVVTIVFAGLAACGGVEVSKAREVYVSILWWFTIIPFGVLCVSFFWNFPKAPYAIYLERGQQFKDDLEAKDVQISKVEAELVIATDLDAKKLADAAEKKWIKDELGDRLVTLQNMKSDIARIGYLDYTEDIGKQKDADLIAALNNTADFLRAKIGGDEAAVFRGTKPKPIGDNGLGYSAIAHQSRMYARQINYLEAFIEQLEAIIKRHQ